MSSDDKKQIAIRVPQSVADRADVLIPRYKAQPFMAHVSVSRSLVLQQAMDIGLTELEQRLRVAFLTLTVDPAAMDNEPAAMDNQVDQVDQVEDNMGIQEDAQVGETLIDVFES